MCRAQAPGVQAVLPAVEMELGQAEQTLWLGEETGKDTTLSLSYAWDSHKSSPSMTPTVPLHISHDPLICEYQAGFLLFAL